MAKAEVTLLASEEASFTSGEAANAYPMSRDGRRQAIILLLGVGSLWVFALWTLITILEGGISDVEWVSGVLMLGMLLVAPLVAWTLLEEAYSRVQVGDWGVRYETLAGIKLAYTWDELSGYRQESRSRIARFFLGDREPEEAHINSKGSRAAGAAGVIDNTNEEKESEEEPETLMLESTKDGAMQIANPALRFLHRQAHGSNGLPIYGGLEGRDALLREIASRMGPG